MLELYSRGGVRVYRAAAGVRSDEGILECVSRYSGLPADGISVVRPAEGRPFLSPDRGIFFSVSHSGEFWCCAVSDRLVGFDVQQERRCGALGIARRFFHPEEARAVEADPSLFFKIWTAKEAYSKLTGKGITEDFAGFTVVREGSLAPDVVGCALEYLPFPEGYTACLCTARRGRLILDLPV